MSKLKKLIKEMNETDEKDYNEKDEYDDRLYLKVQIIELMKYIVMVLLYSAQFKDKKNINFDKDEYCYYFIEFMDEYLYYCFSKDFIRDIDEIVKEELLKNKNIKIINTEKETIIKSIKQITRKDLMMYKNKYVYNRYDDCKSNIDEIIRDIEHYE